MKFPARAGYFLAGAMLANGGPHLVIGATGRRNLTPFGRDSSSAVNALWGAVNLAGGCTLVRLVDQRTGAGADPDAWLPPLLSGSLSFSLFGLIYERGRKRAARRSDPAGASPR